MGVPGAPARRVRSACRRCRPVGAAGGSRACAPDGQRPRPGVPRKARDHVCVCVHRPRGAKQRDERTHRAGGQRRRDPARRGHPWPPPGRPLTEWERSGFQSGQAEQTDDKEGPADRRKTPGKRRRKPGRRKMPKGWTRARLAAQESARLGTRAAARGQRGPDTGPLRRSGPRPGSRGGARRGAVSGARGLFSVAVGSKADELRCGHRATAR